MFITLTDSSINTGLSGYGAALKTQATSTTDFGLLKRPFQKTAISRIADLNGLQTESTDLLMAITWRVSDVPKSLTFNSSTDCFLVQIFVDVGEKVIRDVASGSDNSLNMQASDFITARKTSISIPERTDIFRIA